MYCKAEATVSTRSLARRIMGMAVKACEEPSQCSDAIAAAPSWRRAGSAQVAAAFADDHDVDVARAMVLRGAVAHGVATEVDLRHAFHRRHQQFGRDGTAGTSQAFEQDAQVEVAEEVIVVDRDVGL